MCGRYVQYGSPERLSRLYQLRGLPAFFPRYNIAPGTDVLVILTASFGRRGEMVRWGLRPDGTVANVRDDSADKPWARVLLKSRCVIPANGFYEWRAPAEPHGHKQPFYVTPAADEFFAFAGVIGSWEGRGVSLFTTGANVAMQPIHDRMPVLLDAAGVDAWLDPGTSVNDVLDLLRPPPADSVRAWPVSTAVNDPRHDGAELIARVVD